MRMGSGSSPLMSCPLPASQIVTTPGCSVSERLAMFSAGPKDHGAVSTVPWRKCWLSVRISRRGSSASAQFDSRSRLNPTKRGSGMRQLPADGMIPARWSSPFEAARCRLTLFRLKAVLQRADRTTGSRVRRPCEHSMPSLLALYTLLHVAISLVAIVAGFVVIAEMLQWRESARWTALFLITTILTSVTGFGFPATQLTPGHVFGIVSLIALGLAVYGRYSRKLAGKWRAIYVITAIFAQYLNFVVLIVQSFQKVQLLHALPPSVSLVVQVVALLVFIVLGTRAVARFQPGGNV